MIDWFFYFLSTRHLTKENNFGIDDPKAGASKKFYLYDVSKCAHVVVLFQDVNVLTATYRNGVVVSVISAVYLLFVTTPLITVFNPIISSLFLDR